jgi:hypothetical protein
VLLLVLHCGGGQPPHQSKPHRTHLAAADAGTHGYLYD